MGGIRSPFYDSKAWICAIFASTAFLLCLYGGTYCHFISFRSPYTGENYLFSGIWNNEDPNTKQCVLYGPYWRVDSPWKTARAFTIVTGVLGGIATFWLWLSPCFILRPQTWKTMSLVFVFCSLFEGLTLLFLQSYFCTKNINYIDDLGNSFVCQRSWGANATIAAIIFWFATGLSMWKIPPPSGFPRPPRVEKTVTYTQTTQLDGTKVVTDAVVQTTVSNV